MDQKETILKQVEIANKAVETLKGLNESFNGSIQLAKQRFSPADLKQIESLEVLQKNVINLANQGKTKEAEDLIKQFGKNGN
jgi:hypothetical protein